MNGRDAFGLLHSCGILQPFVNIFAVAYFDDPDGQYLILDRVSDTVAPLPNAVEFLSCQFYAINRPWINSQ
jgi:hypothetical protein